uniref:Uncharacterized protein n=1 Tax=Chromera velia CCMP2878 TaxID=1169474 RepID=A0A0G4GPR8_9ALVE|eukprot:Cvel_22841.t1-p1 / transcript=Cvel_22841.t1 / gene=Cvel_22841 / organism=Chromera_velia_CCMP2878 / gene_product=hypothetical protein / transcript_product=hypothetical protein / location=Cvel_scaffold2289:2346-9124(-) / protein_length=931 / sequence_SO=supercontig / SO=protein_coding / is_pseudo=false
MPPLCAQTLALLGLGEHFSEPFIQAARLPVSTGPEVSQVVQGRLKVLKDWLEDPVFPERVVKVVRDVCSSAVREEGSKLFADTDWLVHSDKTGDKEEVEQDDDSLMLPDDQSEHRRADAEVSRTAAAFGSQQRYQQGAPQPCTFAIPLVVRYLNRQARKAASRLVTLSGGRSAEGEFDSEGNESEDEAKGRRATKMRPGRYGWAELTSAPQGDFGLWTGTGHFHAFTGEPVKAGTSGSAQFYRQEIFSEASVNSLYECLRDPLMKAAMDPEVMDVRIVEVLDADMDPGAAFFKNNRVRSHAVVWYALRNGSAVTKDDARRRDRRTSGGSGLGGKKEYPGADFCVIVSVVEILEKTAVGERWAVALAIPERFHRGEVFAEDFLLTEPPKKWKEIANVQASQLKRKESGEGLSAHGTGSFIRRVSCVATDIYGGALSTQYSRRPSVLQTLSAMGLRLLESYELKDTIQKSEALPGLSDEPYIKASRPFPPLKDPAIPAPAKPLPVMPPPLAVAGVPLPLKWRLSSKEGSERKENEFEGSRINRLRRTLARFLRKRFDVICALRPYEGTEMVRHRALLEMPTQTAIPHWAALNPERREGRAKVMMKQPEKEVKPEAAEEEAASSSGDFSDPIDTQEHGKTGGDQDVEILPPSDEDFDESSDEEDSQVLLHKPATYPERGDTDESDDDDDDDDDSEDEESEEEEEEGNVEQKNPQKTNTQSAEPVSNTKQSADKDEPVTAAAAADQQKPATEDFTPPVSSKKEDTRAVPQELPSEAPPAQQAKTETSEPASVSDISHESPSERYYRQLAADQAAAAAKKAALAKSKQQSKKNPPSSKVSVAKAKPKPPAALIAPSDDEEDSDDDDESDDDDSEDEDSERGDNGQQTGPKGTQQTRSPQPSAKEGNTNSKATPPQAHPPQKNLATGTAGPPPPKAT